MGLKVHIIGAGRLGMTLGHLLAQNHAVDIIGVVNRDWEHALAAQQFIGAGTPYTDLQRLPMADVFLITCPDDAIAVLAQQLSTNPSVGAGSIAFHCSGSLTSEALLPLKAQGLWVASAHPMQSFADPKASVKAFPGTYCALEGDAPALAVIGPLFESIKAITYLIHKDKKALYHAGGVFASNYVVALSQQALTCLSAAGIEQEIAMRMQLSLMKQTIANLENSLSPQLALTGPIQRGDVQTIEKHLQALGWDNLKLKNVYACLGQATLALVPCPNEQHKTIGRLLSACLGDGG